MEKKNRIQQNTEKCDHCPLASVLNKGLDFVEQRTAHLEERERLVAKRESRIQVEETLFKASIVEVPDFQLN